MIEGVVIFFLAAAGSSVSLARDIALEFLARKVLRQSMAVGSGVEQAAEAAVPDPLPALCLALGSFGLIAAGVVAALPGEHVIRRMLLAFALLCVGGLIAEISRPHADSADLETDRAAKPAPGSLGLALVLMLLLDTAFAILGSGQGLVEIVPPVDAIAHIQSLQLPPIVVVGRRGLDPLENSSSFL